MGIIKESIIKKLSEAYNKSSSKEKSDMILILEKIFDDYLKENPYDSDYWVRMALLVFGPPLGDDFKALTCAKKVLEYDSTNFDAALLFGYIKDYSFIIDDEAFHILSNLKSTNNEIASMIEYEKYFYYRLKEDKKNIEQSLLKSIFVCDKHVWNNIDLGRFYLQSNQIDKAKYYIAKGFSNIQYIYKKEDAINGKFDSLDIQEFFNESIKGIHLTSVNYEILQEQFEYVQAL